ncbi:amino acid adenylation domain-containing protein [Kitasatospora sp. NPDC127116]|uniref:amino acid adenylation domain-containing protein n=1 Tax=Kitasatospora sp. NPDC127116 TaxID=3345367 RepID=UPI0036271DFC
MSQLTVEDVWPLSPLQEGLLFHASYDQDAPRDVYVGQRILNLDGDLRPEVLEASWQAVLDRHASLRAAFRSRASGDTVQVIARGVRIPWTYADLGGLGAEEAEREAARLAEVDARRFDLGVPPLLRVLLLRAGPGRHRMVVTMHHILMDGWSLPILFGELWEVYGNGGDASVLPKVPQYRDYLAWLVRRDTDASRAAWRAMLAGTEEPTLVGPADRGGPPVMLRHVVERLGDDLAERLRETARSAGVTFNRVFQVAWALLVGKLSGRLDTVFGATVSGRPAEVPQADRMVGLFINTVPVRVPLDPALPFRRAMAALQDQQTALLDHQQLSLPEIQRAGGPGAVFDTLMVFQNYPRGPMAAPSAGPAAPAGPGRAPRPADGSPPGEGLGGTALRSGEQAGGPLGPPPGDGREPPGPPPGDGREPPGGPSGIGLRGPAGIRVSAGGGEEAAHYPLTIVVTPTDDIEVRLDYRPDLFDERTARGLVDRMLLVLRQVADDPDVPLGRLDVLTGEERHELDGSGYRTRRELPGATLAELFEQQARRTPGAVAVVAGDTELTYAGLDRRANRLARRLAALGVRPETLVGVVAERSPELIAALLAVVKAGAAYLPMDGRHPAARLAATAAQAGAAVVLVDGPNARRGLADAALFEGAEVLLLEPAPAGPDSPDSPGSPAANGDGAAFPAVPVRPENLMYVVYTSGSTGLPKGVAVTYGSVLAFCLDGCWSAETLERVLVQANHAFDASTYEIWTTLLHGGRLVLVPPGDIDTVERGRLIADQKVTSVHATAGHFRVLAEQAPHIFAGVREVSTGGDVVSAHAVRTLLRSHPGLVVRTTYGPTESTAFATQLPFTDPDAVPDAVPLGLPMDNTRAFVLDAFLRPVPVGMTGELYLAGAGLARGYLGRASLTAERFVACPFPAEGEPEGARMYRTGDLAQWTRDGQLLFLGRSDKQLKIRGFRVEPAEIEAVLAAHPGVAQALVVAVEDADGRKRLAGYAVPAGGGEAPPEPRALVEYLAGKLPDYLVPASVTVLEALPVTANGKVDRAALPRPVFAGPAQGRAAATDAEELLCRLFAEVLNLERVGAEDSFFGLGGDSITSMLLAGRARKAGLAITPRQVFELRTPAELARVAEPVDAERAARPEDVPWGPVPLTPVMHEIAARTGSAARAGSQSMVLTAPPGLTPGLLAAVLRAVLDRHDVLRARLEEADGRLVVPEPGAAPAVAAADLVTRVEAAGLDGARLDALLDEQAAAAEAALAPRDGVMLRAVLVDRGPAQDALVLLTAHHLVIDGVSWRVLMPDLALAHTALAAGGADAARSAVAPEPTSFRRWAGALAERARAQRTVDELPAWRRVLDRVEPPIAGRALDPRTDTVGGGVSRAELTVPAPMAGALLAALPAAYHAGVDDVLLSGLTAALDEWLRARGGRAPEGFLIDREAHGRVPLAEDMDLTRTVGWFTAVHPVRLEPGPVDTAEVRAGGADAARLIKRVKEQLRQVPGDGLGYGLLRYVNPATRAVLEPLAQPQIGFNYLGRFGGAGGEADVPGADGVPAGAPAGVSARAWTPAGERPVPDGGVDPSTPLRHVLEINGSARDLPGGPELGFVLESPGGLLTGAELGDLAGRWRAVLEGLVRHAAEGSGGHTPSDFSLISLGQEDIDEFESAFGGEGEGRDEGRGGGGG